MPIKKSVFNVPQLIHFVKHVSKMQLVLHAPQITIYHLLTHVYNVLPPNTFTQQKKYVKIVPSFLIVKLAKMIQIAQNVNKTTN